MAKNYKELIAWQKAMELVEMVYAVSSSFPSEELYGLTSQVRRAAVSIPSNKQRVKAGSPAENLSDFYLLPMAPFARQKPNS